jgi:S-DNA-T family DNA segregation ATPase FtsK/SpoIIIE
MNKMIYAIGVTITAKGEAIVYIDLENQPHVLVGGITGSGKTTFLKCLLTGMVLNDVDIIIIDMKMGGDYNVFRYYKNLKAFVKTVAEADVVIEKIKAIKDERFSMLDKTNCKDFTDYNLKHNNEMKPLVILIEEYTMLSKDKNFNNELNIILAQARAVNIKVILSVQRPCQDNLDSRLKANLNHTVAFKVKNTYNSEILLDKGDLRAVKDLHGSGEAILSNDTQDVMFKSFFLEDREIKKMIRDRLNYNKRVVVRETVQAKDAKEGII